MREIGERKPPLRRYAAEVLTIVVGVLLALTADAGRQYLADRATEREILAALRVEFAADVREIGRDQEWRTRKLAGIGLLDEGRAVTATGFLEDTLAAAAVLSMDWRWYTASHPKGERVGALQALRSDIAADLTRRDTLRFPHVEGREEARRSLLAVGSYTTFDANTAAIESLKCTGSLQLIEHPELRSAILTNYDSVEDDRRLRRDPASALSRLDHELTRAASNRP